MSEEKNALNDDITVSSERRFIGPKSVSKEEYDYARAKVLKRKNANKRIRLLSILFAILIFVSLTFLYYKTSIEYYYSRGYPINEIIFNVVLRFILSVFAYFFMYYYAQVLLDSTYSKYQTTIDFYELEHLQNDVEENIFESSLKMSYKYLDLYYAQTREQARKGFLITICVTIAGALLLFIGIISMFINKTDASKITVASGVIVEFISAIMFYLYNKTIQSMGNYHDKLFLSQNIAIALKVSDSLSDDKRDDIKSQIVKELITDVNAYIVASDDKNDKSEKK